jgi:Response regulator containing CheY-like receiver, AAA-type ATPase, and DNA-binding domains
VQDVAQLIQAITGLLWPLITAVLLWRLLPALRKVIESRDFSVKVGGVELSVQELADKLVKSTAELQAKASAAAPAPDEPQPSATPMPEHRTLRRILWVDDDPQHNAYETAQLEALGASVTTVRSTREAMAALDQPNSAYDAVITDMSRHEDTSFNPDAGIDLISAMRAANIDVPVIVYASDHARHREGEVVEAGGEGVTSRPTELFGALGKIGRFAG